MSESIVEVVLLILLVFFIGCILGYVLRVAIVGATAKTRQGPVSSSAAEIAHDSQTHQNRAETAKMAKLAVPSVATQLPKPAAETNPPPAPATRRRTGPSSAAPDRARPAKPLGNGAQPKGLPAPRGGSADSLQKISGVGPKIEIMLHELGIFHFDQIAGWSQEQAQWVDNHLKFKGRIGRDEWVNQAMLLAQGKDEEFASLYGNVVSEKKSNKNKGPPRTRTPQR